MFVLLLLKIKVYCFHAFFLNLLALLQFVLFVWIIQHNNFANFNMRNMFVVFCVLRSECIVHLFIHISLSRAHPLLIIINLFLILLCSSTFVSVCFLFFSSACNREGDEAKSL